VDQSTKSQKHQDGATDFYPATGPLHDRAAGGDRADDLRSALDAAFAGHPRLRGYVLDEQGHLRENVVIFIDGQRTRERQQLDDTLAPDSKVYILQALSGG
jgi:molybdopterin synthase sulfur carrier subunit